VAAEKTSILSPPAPSPARGKAGMGVRKAVQRARELRRNPTDTERKLWHQIENFRFRRQRPIGKYIVDFICLEANLVIELDGGQHVEQQQYDAERTKYLTAQGLHVLRYWNNDVMQNIEGVLEDIRAALMRRTPSQPSPREGKELIVPIEESVAIPRSTPSPAPRGSHRDFRWSKAGMGALNTSPPPPKNQNGKTK
jgi:very-short-patch-repair endonuclease